MRVAIHQPEYLPWLGLIDKARQADVFVLFDDVQFNRSSLQNRARIAEPSGKTRWLTIPCVHRFPEAIRDVEAAENDWPGEHARIIQAVYRGTPGLTDAGPALDALYAANYPKMADAAVASMRLLFEVFGVKTPLLRSSDIGGKGQKGDLVLDLCRRLGATEYLSGRTAATTYLDHAAFAAAGVPIVVQEFAVPRYRSGLPGVTLSALDAWMYLGDGAGELLQVTHHEERV